MLSDLLRGEELARAYSRLYAATGAGVFLGIQAGSLAHRFSGHPRYSHLCRFCFAGVLLAHNITMPETLPPGSLRSQEPLRLRDANPLGFLRLFHHSRALMTLGLAATLMHGSEGKATGDLRALWVSTDVQIPLARQGFFLSSYGLLTFLGCEFGARCVLPRLGRRNFTTLASALVFLGHWLLSVPRELTCWAGLLVLGPGINANGGAGLKAFATEHAVLAGMGKGEYAACMGTMRSLMMAVFPVVYARAYGAERRSGRTGRRTWWLVMLIGALIPELLHRSLCDSDLKPRRTGQDV